MTEGNYVRNLLGLDVAVVCGYCGRAPPPATARPRDHAPPLLSNFARNSPAITSNIEFVPLELQGF